MQCRPGSGNRRSSVRWIRCFTSCGSFVPFRTISCGSSPLPHARAWRSSSSRRTRGLYSPSVTAAQFLRERMLRPPTAGVVPRFIVGNSLEREGGTELQRGAIAVISQPAVNERGGEGSVLESRGMSALERRREELESGPGGDHDLPHSFSLPLSLPQVLAWMTLLARVQRGELHP